MRKDLGGKSDGGGNGWSGRWMVSRFFERMSGGGGGSDWRYSFLLLGETHTTTITRNKFS